MRSKAVYYWHGGTNIFRPGRQVEIRQLFAAENFNWIEPRSPKRWDKRGGDRDRGHTGHHRGERKGVPGRDTEQHAGENAGEADRQEEAGIGAEESDAQ